MRWQKAARVGVALVGAGTAVALFVFTRERPEADPPALDRPADPTAAMQSGAGQDERYQGNSLLGTLTYDDFRTYDDGRIVWQGFRYALRDGAVLSADQVEARGTAAAGDRPDELRFTGHVRFERPDGTILTGESGTYSEVTGHARLPGPVSFTRGHMSGTGTGGEYDRETGSFRLLADTRITMTGGDSSRAPVEASSVSMTFTTESKVMVFNEQAELVRANETLAGDQAALYLTNDEQAFRLIELRGRSRVTPSADAVSSLPEMAGGDIDLAFYEDGQALQQARIAGDAKLTEGGERGRRSIEADTIELATAPDGRTITRLQATPRGLGGRVVVRLPGSVGAPARTVTAGSLVASGNGKSGLTAAVFERNVEFVEATAGRGGRAAGAGRAGRGAAATDGRVGTAERLTLALKGQLDAIEQARFDRDVEFRSGGVRGHGEVGIYRAVAGELDLQPGTTQPLRRASVEALEAGVNVEASEIVTVYLESGNLYARGDVQTASAGGESTARSTSIFNANERIYGSGTEFRYDDAAMAATYRGTSASLARLQQRGSVVVAEQIAYVRDSQDLNASGSVSSTFEMAASGPSGNATTATYQVTADTLVYAEQARAATYTGNARLESAEAVTTAGTLVLTLSATSRTLERLEARGAVDTSLDGGRRAQGDRLVYDAARDVYELEGKPLTIINREADGTCYGQEGSFARFQGALGAPDFPADRNADGGAPRRSIPCPAAR